MTKGDIVEQLLRFELDNGGAVFVELDEEPSVTPASRHARVLHDAKTSFEMALGGVRDAAAAALGQFQEMARRPDEIEIKFGVQLDVEAGAVIAKTGMKGHFEVKLKWQRQTGAQGVPADQQ